MTYIICINGVYDGYNSLHAGLFCMISCCLLIFKSFLFCFVLKTFFRNTTRVSNSLDSDQTRQNVGHDLGPNTVWEDFQQTKIIITNRERVKALKFR